MFIEPTSQTGREGNSAYNILVVDDEPGMRMYLVDYLRDVEGYTVFEAANGQDALDNVLTLQRIDLVLSDINMPVMKGFELLKIVKEKYPATKRILITAYNVEDYLDLALRHDVANVLVKTVPVNTRELSVLIRNLLRSDIFGMTKYFDGEAEEKFHSVRKGAQLQDDMKSIVAGLPEAFRTARMEIVLLEMLTNAVFYGIRKEAPQNRSDWQYDFELSESEAITVTTMHDKEKCGVSIVDNGGRLKKVDVLYWLYRQLTPGEDDEPIGMFDGHGRGFLIARKYVDRVIVNIERGKRTEVILINYLSGLSEAYKPLNVCEL